jgi:hypothetical protein
MNHVKRAKLMTSEEKRHSKKTLCCLAVDFGNGAMMAECVVCFGALFVTRKKGAFSTASLAGMH